MSQLATQYGTARETASPSAHTHTNTSTDATPIDARHQQGTTMNTLDDVIRDAGGAGSSSAPHARSRAVDRACDVMPGGVTSSWSSTRPIPVWIDRGEGSHVWDVDGNEYVDYHAGYGVNVVGHANPHVVEAVQRRVTMGTHFAQPIDDSIVVAEVLADRFGLPQWRSTTRAPRRRWTPST